MSEYAERHRGDYGKLTDLSVFEHCLPTEEVEDMGMMYPDQMLATLHENLAVPVRLPVNMGFDQLQWNVLRWPQNRTALMFGTNPDDDQQPEISRALGTVVLWQDAVHIAGVQRPAGGAGRVLAGRYTPQTDFDSNTTYQLFRGDIVVSQPELALDNAALAKAAKMTYTYLAHGDNLVERRFVNPAPSHFDGQIERPFDTAGLITPGMLTASWEEAGRDPQDKPVAFTYYHKDWTIPRFAMSWSKRNRILAATPHIAPLQGDAHRILVDGTGYELPTCLPSR